MNFEFIVLIFLSALRLSAPLIFAALGGLLSERSGVIQLALEGFMLIGAFVGASVTYYTKSPWMGWWCGFLAGILWAQIYCFFVLKLKSDQIVTGTALNLLALGLIPFASKILFNSTGSSPNLEMNQRFSYEAYVICALAVALVAYVFYKTPLGLRLQFAGEKPEALESAGFSVVKHRWFFVSFGGALAALGGATLSMSLASSYSPMMTAGRGYMALAAVIFGRWKPLPTLFAALFFSFTEALQLQLQGLSEITHWIPTQLLQALPYIFTILFLAAFKKSSVAPKYLGQ